MFSPEYVEVAVTPLPAQKAARRALCLATLVMRGEIEMTLQEATPQQRLDLTQNGRQDPTRPMQRWLENEGLHLELSLQERAMMAKPLGAWEQGETLRAVWRQESLVAILWSMGLLPEMPRYDELADQEDLLQLVPVNRPTRDFMRTASYRPAEEIAHGRKAAEIWHWRAKIYEMQADPANFPAPAGASYDRIVAIAAEMGELNGFYTRIGDDFPAKGKSYRELTEEEWALLKGIAMERYYGFNWISGYGEDWDHVPTNI